MSFLSDNEGAGNLLLTKHLDESDTRRGVWGAFCKIKKRRRVQLAAGEIFLTDNIDVLIRSIPSCVSFVHVCVSSYNKQHSLQWIANRIQRVQYK